MIPKNIWTIWLNDERPLPELYEKCIATQKLDGYNHHIITLENLETSSQYVRDAIAAKKWVKASDYIRVEYIVKYGGIHLDADMEVLDGQNFDDLLQYPMFTSRECAGLLANAAFGAEPNHPFLEEYLRRVETNFRGDGEMVFEPGIRAFDDTLWYFREEGKDPMMQILPTECFFPYNHLTGETYITYKTRVIHHYSNSWIPHKSKI